MRSLPSFVKRIISVATPATRYTDILAKRNISSQANSDFCRLYFTSEAEKLRHSAKKIPLFQDCLLSRSSFSKKQHTVFWHNYLMLTSNTIRVIVLALSKMTNLESIELVKQNLLDEVSGPSVTDIHFILLNKSYGILAQKFDLPLITTSNANQSEYIMKVTRRFIKEQNAIYEKSEASAIGASFAQETLALPMLQNIFAFSEKFYKPHLTTEEWKDFSRYFDVHLDGTEKRHAEDAKMALLKSANSTNIEEIINAARRFDSVQNILWRGLHLGIVSLDEESLSMEKKYKTNAKQQNSISR
jgi:hypothetical protein